MIFSSSARPLPRPELVLSIKLMRGWVVLLALAGGVAISGCGSSGKSVRGIPPTDAAISLAAAKEVHAGAPVTIHGKMIEKCPVAGCWFIVKDQSGTLRVDTKAAGWVVLDLPLNTEVTVSGKMASGTSEPMLDASGMRY